MSKKPAATKPTEADEAATRAEAERLTREQAERDAAALAVREAEAAAAAEAERLAREQAERDAAELAAREAEAAAAAEAERLAREQAERDAAELASRQAEAERLARETADEVRVTVKAGERVQHNRPAAYLGGETIPVTRKEAEALVKAGAVDLVDA